jgi:hypothetical protein
MRNVGLALAVALIATLATGVADPAFAAKKKDPNWRDTPIPNQGAQFYRSSSQKKTTSNWRDTPIPNQSAQFYGSNSKKGKKNKSQKNAD